MILETIRQAIRASGKTSDQISKKTGIPRPRLARLPQGGTALSLESLEKLADALDFEIILRPRSKKNKILGQPLETLNLFGTHDELSDRARSESYPHHPPACPLHRSQPGRHPELWPVSRRGSPREARRTRAATEGRFPPWGRFLTCLKRWQVANLPHNPHAKA
jgi:transcriptional regulator with XRE-family HTH domain